MALKYNKLQLVFLARGYFMYKVGSSWERKYLEGIHKLYNFASVNRY